MEKLKVVYYINQFFGQEGGEEAASMGVSVYEGAYGISSIFAKAYGEECEIVATIICGDNYIAEQLDEVSAEILDLIRFYAPDAFVAGPAYAAGRYGVACGKLCADVAAKLHIPAVTGMNELNPGVELYRKHTYIVRTSDNARSAGHDISAMAAFLKKLNSGVALDSPDKENYFAMGYMRNIHVAKMPPERAVDMLLNKFYGRPFRTEIPLPRKIDVPRPAAIMDLSHAEILLATDGGLYPADNPDNMPYANADRCGVYSIAGIESLRAGEWIIRHSGYDNTISNEDPNRLVPVDAMRTLEKEGVIGKLHDAFLSTTGLVATVDNATKTGQQIVKYVKSNGIDAVIITST